MAYLSETALNAAVAAIVGDDNTIGATLYLAVSTTTPSETGGVISGVTEPSGGGYARVAIPNDDTNWNIDNGVGENATTQAFPEATADWSGDVTHGVIFDASTGGNALWFGALTDAPLTVETGGTLTFEPGQITITFA